MNERWKNPAAGMAIALTVLSACLVSACKEEDTEPANKPPAAAFLVSNLTPGNNEEVSFTDQSADEDGKIMKWEWNFGDGSTSQEQHPKKTFETEGAFTVKLTVTDDDGDRAEATREITVSTSNLAPVAAFSLEVPGQSTELFAIVMENTAISFKDLSEDKDGSIAGWSWDMGDGTTSTSRNLEHTYATGGTYTVSLTVTDDEGETNTLSKKVYVPKIKWSYPVNKVDTSCPAIDDDGNIYVADASGVIYKLSKSDGTAMWSYNAGTQIRASIVISDDNTRLYIGSGKKFHALKTSDGQAAWAIELPGNADKSSAALDKNGNVYFGTADGKLFSVKALDGTQNWVFDGGISDGSIQSSPLYSNGKVAVTISNKLFGINASTGEKAWEYNLQANRYEGNFAINDAGILFGGAENTENKSGRIFAINLSTGAEVWGKQVPGEVRANSPILGPDGTLYVSTEDGADEKSMSVYALNSNTGAEKWVSKVAGDDFKVAPTLGKSGVLYIGSNDDHFYMISSVDGTLLCRFSYESADHLMVPAIGSDGTVYFSSRGNLFYAMKILDEGEESLPQGGWPIVGGSLKHQNRK
ncbi:MAG: hypothetical protein ABS46_20705 [Cytophagaceae bacterium SCN 52-12]|nr:MAG: hypothetical protein ABS46_20705 [Cytophagaceae bacterium SCN 52-12]